MPTVTYESVRQDTRLLNKAGYADTTKDKKEDFPMKKLICMMAALALSVAMICTACAETIQAKPVTIDMDHLENRMVKTDIEYKEGDMMTLTLYVPETFDAEAIKAVKAGDVIVTDGEEVAIETVDADGPDIIFNKGMDSEMLFCDKGNGEFEHVEESDYVPWIKIGTKDVEILEYYPILDIIDPKTGEILDEYNLYRGDKLKELLQDPDAVGFNVKNTDVVYDWNNQIVLIKREYSSAQ